MNRRTTLLILLPAYLFLLVRSNFRYVNVYTSLFFYLNLFLGAAAVLSALNRLRKNDRERRLRNWIILVSCCLSILTVEILLRFGLKRHVNYMEANAGWYLSLFENNHGGWYYRYHTRGPVIEEKKEFRFEYSVNSAGLADREHRLTKAPGEFRIIALGDSFTAGVGAEQGASWPAQLAGILNAKRSGPKIDVINAGISGSDPVFAFVLLRDRLARYRPDLVILAINDSDRNDVLVRGGMGRFRPDGSVVFREGPSWEWLYSLSFIFRSVLHDVLDYNMEMLPRKDWPKYLAAASRILLSCLHDFAGLSARNDFRLLVVFHPMDWEIAAGHMIFSDLLAQASAAPGIEVLDLFVYFTKKENFTKNNLQRFYWPTDRHHTAAGYAAFARGVAWKLREMGVVH